MSRNRLFTVALSIARGRQIEAATGWQTSLEKKWRKKINNRERTLDLHNSTGNMRICIQIPTCIRRAR
ncbi:hypothetical protein QE152_g970 [Popillia japonica]|uniref:Secreted protein n=1 Tax=Popillia japonica TaxID=7064 RepID=A0AAW1NAE8_POPJA